MRLVVTKMNLGLWAAAYVKEKINAFQPSAEKPFVLGLPTGGTVMDFYANLRLFHKEKLLDFQHIVTFNMDEYVGLPQDHPQSYHSYMRHHLFNEVNIRPENIHILNGQAQNLEEECRLYEQAISAAGGIDLFLGGVGRNGHIAFNEPGSSLSSRTRVKTLTTETIEANSRFFGGDMSKVPTTVLTMGIGTIMDAEEVLIIATGDKKARAIHHAVEGSINHMWPISILQMHQHGIIVCDEPATNELKADTVRYFKDIENQLRPKIK